jgi:hypothetical protein
VCAKLLNSVLKAFMPTIIYRRELRCVSFYFISLLDVLLIAQCNLHLISEVDHLCRHMPVLCSPLIYFLTIGLH